MGQARSVERRSQGQRRERTRRALLGAAGECSAESGYRGAAAEEIVRRAGVSRGAMYHHFGDKLGLFRAVVEEIEADIDARVEAADGGVIDGCYAFLDACLEPEVKRILLVDGPAALGWEEWHRIEADHALAQIQDGLRSAGVESRQTRPLAHLIHGSLIEAAMFIANAEDPELARREIGESLERLLGGLVARENH